MGTILYCTALHCGTNLGSDQMRDSLVEGGAVDTSHPLHQ